MSPLDILIRKLRVAKTYKGKLDYMPGQSFLEILLFLLEVDEIDELLNCVGSLLVAAYDNEVFSYSFEDLHSLTAGAVYQKSLAEIVSVIIDHYLRE
jgi:hypothetical protein